MGRSTARERLAPFPVSLGPWPMCGGKGDRRIRGKRSSSSQPGWRPLAAWVFPGRFLILTLKRGMSTCLKRARDFVPAFRLHFSHWGAPSTCNPPSNVAQGATTSAAIQKAGRQGTSTEPPPMPTQPPPGPWDSVGGQVGIIYPQLSCRGCAYMAVDWHLPAGGLPLGSGARSRISATSSSVRPQLSPCRSYIPKTPIWCEFRPRCDPISKRAFSRAVRSSGTSTPAGAGTSGEAMGVET